MSTMPDFWRWRTRPPAPSGVQRRRALARQHEVRGDGGVADETRLGARREEPHAQIVIRCRPA